jgi:hypothetical protein
MLVSSPWAPGGNAICERINRYLRKELFDRLLIVNEHPSRLSSHSPQAGYLASVWEWGGIGPPPRQGHHSGFDQLQVREESGDLLRAAGMVCIG